MCWTHCAGLGKARSPLVIWIQSSATLSLCLQELIINLDDTEAATPEETKP